MLRSPMDPPNLPMTDAYDDTRADESSFDQGLSGPQPDRLAPPLGTQGRARRPVTQSELDELLMTPHRIGDLHRAIERLSDIVALSLGPVAWSPIPTQTNVTATSFGSGGYIIAAKPLADGSGVALRNIQVGGSGAGIVQLIASANDKLYSDRMGERVLAVVRLTANQLSQTIAQMVRLRSGETLFALCTNAVITMDFAGEYRAMRSE